MTDSEKAMWLAGLGEHAVWRDGLDSVLSYLIFSVRLKEEQYTCVCARKISAGFKVKFYPDHQFWGVTKQQLLDLGATSFVDRTTEARAGYVRFCMDERQLRGLIGLLESLRGVVTVPADVVLAEYDRPHGERSKRGVHPTSGGGTPRTPFKPPENVVYAENYVGGAVTAERQSVSA